MKPNHTNTKNVVALGFALVVVLMVSLLLIGVRMAENSQQRLDELVHINNLGSSPDRVGRLPYGA